MRRVIYDVPKWSLYLHRAARGLHRADVSDAPDRKLEDELFERLFTGEVEEIPEIDRYALLADWASRIHDTVSQLPAFARLMQECRGRADESALAVEALMAEIKPDDQDDVLRRTARAACGKASVAIEELREAMEGLEHVAFGQVPGVGTSQHGTSGDGGNARSLAARLRDSPRLREIAKLAGRFKRIAGGKRRSKVKHGADELMDVEVGAEVSRLLPLELALLVHPSTKLLAMRNLLERNSLQYRLEGTEVLGKGPLVVALDRSGSMEGARDVWSSAVALALLSVAQIERRPFALLGFDASVKHESLVMPGQALPEAGLFMPCDGGTDIDNVIRRGLEIIEEHPNGLKKADIVLISDGGSNADNADELCDRATRNGVNILGVAIDVDPSRLEPWCDTVIAAHDMDRLDDKTADALFGDGGGACGRA